MVKKQKKKNSGIQRNHAITIVAIVIIAAVGTYGYFSYTESNKPITVANWGEVEIPFRVDLREAENVQVIPGNEELRSQLVKLPHVKNADGSTILRSPMKNITIAFKSASRETGGWYTVQISEFIKKTTILYKGGYNVDINFNIIEVQSYDGLEGKSLAPVVAFIHPEIADGTYIKVDSDNHVITVSGGDSLKDFDLATTKLLMVMLDMV